MRFVIQLCYTACIRNKFLMYNNHYILRLHKITSKQIYKLLVVTSISTMSPLLPFTKKTLHIPPLNEVAEGIVKFTKYIKTLRLYFVILQ